MVDRVDALLPFELDEGPNDFHGPFKVARQERVDDALPRLAGVCLEPGERLAEPTERRLSGPGSPEQVGAEGHNARHDEPERREDERGLVRQPHGGGLGLLRGPDEADDAGEGAGGGARVRLHLERRAGVHRSAAQRIAGGANNRQRLPGQRGFIQHCGIGGDPAIHRDHLAARHQQMIAGLHRFQRHGNELPILIAPYRLGYLAEQRRHLTPRPSLSIVLQSPAAGEHQADHAGHDVFVQGERAPDRQQRDQVEPKLHPQQAGDAVDQYGGEHRDCAGEQEPVRPILPPCPTREQPQEQAGNREQQQENIQLTSPVCHHPHSQKHVNLMRIGCPHLEPDQPESSQARPFLVRSESRWGQPSNNG